MISASFVEIVFFGLLASVFMVLVFLAAVDAVKAGIEERRERRKSRDRLHIDQLIARRKAEAEAARKGIIE